MSTKQRDEDEPRTPAAALLARIGRLAHQARTATESLADRLMERAVTRSRPAAAPESEPEPEITTAPAPYALDSVDEDLPALPSDYGEARVVLLSRDPHWLFCYWELPEPARDSPRVPTGRLALRLHDVTDLEFDGSNSWSQHLYPMTEGARWWHVPLPRPDRYYLAEVGRLAPSGAFTALGRSEATATPAAGPSAEVGEEMATVPLSEPVVPHGPRAQPFAPPVDAPVMAGDLWTVPPDADGAPAPTSAPTSSSPWSVPR